MEWRLLKLNFMQISSENEIEKTKDFNKAANGTVESSGEVL